MSARTLDINKITKQGNIQVKKDGSIIDVLLHGNRVLSYMPLFNQIVVSSCGWKTSTTKTTINNAFKQLNSNYSLFQNKGIWYVSFKGERMCEFNDGMILNLGE